VKLEIRGFWNSWWSCLRSKVGGSSGSLDTAGPAQPPLRTGSSISESRHEHFPFLSLDLSCCCYSLSRGWAKPEPSWAPRWAHGGQGRHPFELLGYGCHWLKLEKVRQGFLRGPVLDPGSPRAAPKRRTEARKNSTSTHANKQTPIC